MAIIRVRLALRPDGSVPMVQDYRALFAGVRRYIGMRLDASLGGFVASGDTIALNSAEPHFNEYVRHMRDGDLVPADETSAMLAGVPFRADAAVVPVDVPESAPSDS